MNRPESKKDALQLNQPSSDTIAAGSESPTAAPRDDSLSPSETESRADGRREITPVVFRGFRQQLARRWAACVLALIVVSAALLSLFWVFEVPILQNPDEDSHIDYAFSIYSAGRLLNAHRAPSEWNLHPQVEGPAWERISHQYTLYLINATDFQRIRFHVNEKAPPGYGTIEYYRKLDLNAPRENAKGLDLRPADNPWLVTDYPFGYYALVATWLGILNRFTSSLVVLFFATRVLSVLMLCVSIVLSYAILRALRIGKGRALTLTSIVAFFPLTTFVSSSVQPDNLALLLVMLCFYCGLLLRRWGSDRLWLLAVLGIALGALIVTKYHFFLFTVVSVLGMFISDHIFRREAVTTLLGKLSILLFPSVLLFGVELWVVHGGRQITGSNYPLVMRGAVGGVEKAFMNFYAGGEAFISWWGKFGWMDSSLVIGSLDNDRRIKHLLLILTMALLALTLFRLEQVTTRLILLARRRWRWALRIAFSNPLINTYFLFTLFMIFLYALTAVGAQGRHWFPYILSSFLITTQYAPKAFTHRRTQEAFSALMVLGLLLYCAIGSYYSIQSLKRRYYIPEPASVTSIRKSDHLSVVSTGGHALSKFRR